MLDVYMASERLTSEAANGADGNLKNEGKTPHTYPSDAEVRLNIVNCLALSCKYNEIYPPSLKEICQLVGTEHDNAEVIKNEMRII